MISILLAVIPIILGFVLKIRKRFDEVSAFLIGYGILNLISKACKWMIEGHAKPYIGMDWTFFIINHMAYLFIPCWLLYCLFKSVELEKFNSFPLTAWACASAFLIWAYPSFLAGAALIGALRAFYLSILGISLVIGLILFFYKKAKLPQSLLLLAEAEGILQYLIAIFSPSWSLSWLVLSIYYIVMLVVAVLPSQYIDRIDALTIDSSGK